MSKRPFFLPEPLPTGSEKSQCTSARSVADHRYAIITAQGACARYAGAPASATTRVSKAGARSVADRRYASITARGANARYAGALRMPLTSEDLTKEVATQNQSLSVERNGQSAHHYEFLLVLKQFHITISAVWVESHVLEGIITLDDIVFTCFET